ncbi:uncharacterized protein LOC130135924 [Syzygium oleosum]|uniref:uncharacterized protein LOC130135924 n=1 Tax=Syzygium oleosum TaxID=219896 RepID=UPI0024BAD906|nr:uncharacterized protein LOC130135924 [Syzygium oleosum]XP_056161786.1 uncharacterized protein LOC130135924 [Syzygium oleosum]XP_056161788.1 uncharacterized protein LOC130135924 [Syzygium oleosum]XP_056161789.1 uncharacterized protein LOC130135924 [Syzygium oleosum]XP_056161790.1 uncharacterized protein LOC130135924 [Syzygium oleosum]
MATFERTFQKKDKTWTGNRAKAITDKYDELVMSTAAASGDGDGDGDGDGVAASEPSVDSMALWMEASGGMRIGQIFGMGSLSRMYRTPAAGTSSSSAAFLRAQHEERQDQALNRLRQLLVQKDEEMIGVKQRLQLIMRHLNLEVDDVPPVPPTNPVGDGHSDDDNEIPDDDADDDDDPC